MAFRRSATNWKSKIIWLVASSRSFCAAFPNGKISRSAIAPVLGPFQAGSLGQRVGTDHGVFGDKKLVEMDQV
jgi:hypothetical protein